MKEFNIDIEYRINDVEKYFSLFKKIFKIRTL